MREEAVTLLVDLASGAFEATDQAECLAALAGLTEPKHIVAVARAAANETVARAALDRLQDDVALAAVARKATLPSIRLEALGRRRARARRSRAVALRTEFKDVALAAVERLSVRDVLDQVADRAKNKTAAKRARALVRAMEAEAEAAAASAARPSIRRSRTRRRRQRAATALCERLEALAAGGLDEGEAALAEIERALARARAPSTRASGPVRGGPVAAPSRRSRSTWRADAERARARQADAEAAAARKALCERIDADCGRRDPGRRGRRARGLDGAAAAVAAGGHRSMERSGSRTSCSRGARAATGPWCGSARSARRPLGLCADAERFAQGAARPARPAERCRRCGRRGSR